jgi:hypothetical protein
VTATAPGQAKPGRSAGASRRRAEERLLLWCGDVERAWRAVTDAVQGASLASDPYGPEVLRIHAEILAADPQTAHGAQALLDEGLGLAAEQGSSRFASRLRAAHLRIDESAQVATLD